MNLFKEMLGVLRKVIGKGREGQMERMLQGMDAVMLKSATVTGLEPGSVSRQPFSHDTDMSKIGLRGFVANLPRMLRMMSSFQRAEELAGRLVISSKRALLPAEFERLETYVRSLGVDSLGYVKVRPQDIFCGKGVPYSHALVISMAMDKDIIATAPSLACMMEVGKTGQAANKLSLFLRNMGYEAAPGHSLGGAMVYPRIAQEAGLGVIGRHGLLITPANGPCNRIAVVYTSIENLGEYMSQDNVHGWVADFCASCGKCIRRCPGQAIREVPEVDAFGNVSCRV